MSGSTYKILCPVCSTWSNRTVANVNNLSLPWSPLTTPQEVDAYLLINYHYDNKSFVQEKFIHD
jgi:hypothetical protein